MIDPDQSGGIDTEEWLNFMQATDSVGRPGTATILHTPRTTPAPATVNTPPLSVVVVVLVVCSTYYH